MSTLSPQIERLNFHETRRKPVINGVTLREAHEHFRNKTFEAARERKQRQRESVEIRAYLGRYYEHEDPD